MIFGFPIVGTMGKRKIFDTRPIKKEQLGKSGDISILAHNASLRFTMRSGAQKLQKRDDLRAGSTRQIPKGLVGGPYPLYNDGGLIGNPAISAKLSSRLSGDQIDMVRDCDDFKQPRVNRFPHTTTPISPPPSWGHID